MTHEAGPRTILEHLFALQRGHEECVSEAMLQDDALAGIQRLSHVVRVES